MGEIIFWTIVRTAIIIPVIWVLHSYINFQFWGIVSLLAIYGAIIHPIIVYNKIFDEKNKDIIESTLCSTCKHFDKSAVLCMKHDKHPTKSFLPCDGLDWEPKNSMQNMENLIND